MGLDKIRCYRIHVNDTVRVHRLLLLFKRKTDMMRVEEKVRLVTDLQLGE